MSLLSLCMSLLSTEDSNYLCLLQSTEDNNYVCHYYLLKMAITQLITITIPIHAIASTEHSNIIYVIFIYTEDKNYIFM